MELSRGEKRKGEKPEEEEEDNGRRGDSDHSAKSEKEDDDDDCIGPSPLKISKPKKRKGK